MPFIIHKIPARTSPFHALFEKEFTDSGMYQHAESPFRRPDVICVVLRHLDIVYRLDPAGVNDPFDGKLSAVRTQEKITGPQVLDQRPTVAADVERVSGRRENRRRNGDAASIGGLG